MKKKELRLAFAMGGGVSLGTFSGAALTEAIKQTVAATGREDSGYERVVVDVFSGASAGTVSLALMLRALSQPASQDSGDSSEVEERLGGQFGTQFFQDLPEGTKQDLMAAQRAQDLQYTSWVERVDLDFLIGGRPGLKEQAGILDRRQLEVLARDLMPPPTSFDGRRILGDRVLFCAALTRLTPFLADARREFSDEDLPVKGSLALAGGLVSRTFDDLRVFDLNFKDLSVDPLEEKPARWRRSHLGASDLVGNPPLLDLRDPRGWSDLVTTSLASAAFPMAFEPVVVERWKHEFGGEWPKDLADEDSYPFTYIDGGTFNNEPIRDAFRLASFMDSGSDPRDFDRRVLFVDPAVSEARIDFRVPVHQRIFLEPPNFLGSLDRVDVRRRSTLDRLLPHAAQVAGSILDQARVVEADEVIRTRDRIQLRDDLRQLLGPILAEGQAPAGWREFCLELLARNRVEADLPATGTVLSRELLRICLEEIAKEEEGQAGGGGEEPAALPTEEEKETLKNFVFLALDLVMDLERQRKDTQLIAIAPVTKGPSGPVILELPDSDLFLFAGFASAKARHVTSGLGRVCATQQLVDCELIPAQATEAIDAGALGALDLFDDHGQPTAEYRGQVDEETAGPFGRLGDRLAQVIEEAHLLNIHPAINGTVLGAVAGLAKGLLDRPPRLPETKSVELRILLPEESDCRFELDGQGDVKPIELDGQRTLFYFGAWSREEEAWIQTDEDLVRALPWDEVEGLEEVDRVSWGRVKDLQIWCHRSLIQDRPFRKVGLPQAEEVRRALLRPYPIFVLELPADKNAELPPWTLVDGAKPLILFGD